MPPEIRPPEQQPAQLFTRRPPSEILEPPNCLTMSGLSEAFGENVAENILTQTHQPIGWRRKKRQRLPSESCSGKRPRNNEEDENLSNEVIDENEQEAALENDDSTNAVQISSDSGSESSHDLIINDNSDFDLMEFSD